MRQEDESRPSGAVGRRRVSSNPFAVSGADYAELYAARKLHDIGGLINRTVARLTFNHPGKLEGIFDGIDFDSDEQLGPNPRRNMALAGLIEGIGELRFTRDDIGPESPVAGQLFSFLLRTLFANDAKSVRGFFMTPPVISGLLAELLEVHPGETVCDPCCGAGALLIEVGGASLSGAITIFGQDISASSAALCRINMIMHGLDDRAIIECGDSLHAPKFLEKDRLQQFDVVVSHPPFGAGNWGREQLEPIDKYGRFSREYPPKNKADFAYISHLLAATKEGMGRMGVVVSRGVLFREATEKTIRRALVEEGLLDAVIALPANLIPDTPIATAILIFKKAKQNRDVMFIDASQGGSLSDLKHDAGAASRVAQWYRGAPVESSRARRVPFAEIAANDFNLNIPLYFQAGSPAPEATKEATLRGEIADLESRITETRSRLDEFLRG